MCCVGFMFVWAGEKAVLSALLGVGAPGVTLWYWQGSCHMQGMYCNKWMPIFHTAFAVGSCSVTLPPHKPQ